MFLWKVFLSIQKSAYKNCFREWVQLNVDAVVCVVDVYCVTLRGQVYPH